MDYKQNETVTISLERYEEMKKRIDASEKLCEELEGCFDIFPSSTKPIDFTRKWYIRLNTAKEQIERVAAFFGYECVENHEN